jgi:hypothetical protein
MARQRLRFEPKQPSASATLRHARAGFTIIELVVTSVLGSLLFAVLAPMIIAHIRSTSTSELGARVRNDDNRIDYFIQTEASEAASVEADPVGNCAAAAAGGATRFNLNVPRNTGRADDLANVVRIYYYTSSGNLRRCGPPINADGSLDYAAAAVDSIVSTNTDLILQTVSDVAHCSGAITDGRQVAYRLVYGDVNIAGRAAGYQPPCEVARTKSYFVQEPVVPTPP